MPEDHSNDTDQQQPGYYVVKASTSDEATQMKEILDKLKIEYSFFATAQEAARSLEPPSSREKSGEAIETGPKVHCKKKQAEASLVTLPDASIAALNESRSVKPAKAVAPCKDDAEAVAAVAVAIAERNSLPGCSAKKNAQKRQLQLTVLGRPLKKIRILTHLRKMPNKKLNLDTSSKSKSHPIESKLTPQCNQETVAFQLFNTRSVPKIEGLSLREQLERAFDENWDKGWRSKSLNLYPTRRDANREAALQQYLQDLKELQEYRKKHSFHGNAAVSGRHMSDASHPLSVFYLNWSWGVSNSYHRDIRRQQKIRPGSSKVSCLNSATLPHFKAHSVGRNVLRYNNSECNGPGQKDEQRRVLAEGKPPDISALKKGRKSKGAAKSLQQIPSHEQVPLHTVLNQAYIAFRPQGWRHYDAKEHGLDTNLERDLAELKEFCTAYPDKVTELNRIFNDDSLPIRKHPSGFSSPYMKEYLGWSWNTSATKDADDATISSIETIKHQVGASPGELCEDVQEVKSNGDEKPIDGRAVEKSTVDTTDFEEQPSATAESSASAPGNTAAEAQRTAATAKTPVQVRSLQNISELELPAFPERLKQSYLRNLDKGWRAAELGFPVSSSDRKSFFQTFGPFSRKQREHLYILDLEALKKFWNDVPSSQYVVLAPPPSSPSSSSTPVSLESEIQSVTKKHKSGINAPWSLTFLNWSWGVSNSYNRDLARKKRRKHSKQSD